MNIRAKIPIRSTTHQDPLQESSHVAWCFVTNVCLVMGYFDLATTADIIAFHGEMLNPFGMSHCPLRHTMIKDDCVSRSSHVFNSDVESFTQRSHTLDCCHSSGHAQSVSRAVHTFTHTFLLITADKDVSSTCLQHLQKQLKVFTLLRCDALANVSPHKPAPTRILTSDLC